MALVIRSSQIHAAGCYTTTPIPKGTTIIEYTGPRISKEEGDRLYENRDYTYLFGVGDGTTVIDGHGMAAFINHSCQPNCEAEEDDAERVWIIALRDIAAGEELTYDYMLYDGEGESPCYCGAKKCRGTMYSKEEVRKQKRAAARKNKSARARRMVSPTGKTAY
jgi:uncharacterized protein